MLFRCFTCGSLGFDRRCDHAGHEERHDVVPIEPRLFTELEYEPDGILASLLPPIRRNQKEAWDEKAGEILDTYESLREPYFVNYLYLYGSGAIGSVDQGGYTTVRLFHEMLERVGFDAVSDIPSLTRKFLRSTAFQQEYREFRSRTVEHLKADLSASLRSWIEDHGSRFRQLLPMFLYLAWEEDRFRDEIDYSPTSDEIPLIPSLPLGGIQQECEAIYFEILVSRLQTRLEGFDPSEYVTIYEVDLLSGVEFEEFLGELFDLVGYEATVTPATGDQGADLLLERFGKQYAVQAKSYSENVGNSAVQQAIAARSHYGCESAMVVTNSYFTPSAKELAESSDVRLVDRDELQQFLDDFNQIRIEQKTAR